MRTRTRTPKPRADPLTLRAIRDLRRLGWEADRIALVFGVPLSTYYRWVAYLNELESRLNAPRRA